MMNLLPHLLYKTYYLLPITYYFKISSALFLSLVLSSAHCSAQNLLPSPPLIEQQIEEIEESEDEDEELTQEDIEIDSNPFSSPEGLNKIVGKKINEDLWEELKGDLPCIEATNQCTKQVQQLAIASNFAVKELTARIEEVQEKIDEARANNKKSVLWEQLSPLVQFYLATDQPISQTDQQFVQKFNTETQQIELEAVPLPPGPLERILGDLANPLRFLNNALSLIGTPILENLLGGGSQQSQQRAIAIGDLQVKVAQLQRDLAQLKEAIREKVALELIELDNLTKEFQISQEIARKDEQRLEIIKISYRFGEYDSESYLNQLANFDRVSASVWRNWVKLRSQLTKLQQLTSEEEE